MKSSLDLWAKDKTTGKRQGFQLQLYNSLPKDQNTCSWAKIKVMDPKDTKKRLCSAITRPASAARCRKCFRRCAAIVVDVLSVTIRSPNGYAIIYTINGRKIEIQRTNFRYGLMYAPSLLHGAR